MRRRILLEVGPHRVTATMARGPRVVWHADGAIDEATDLAAAIQALLKTVTPGIIRPRVTVALAFPFAQVKRLEGLPETKRRRTLTQIVRQNACAFFLRLSPSQAIPEVYVAANGAVWAAAFDRATIDVAISAVRACRFVVDRVEPLPASLPTALSGALNALRWVPETEPGRATLTRRVTVSVVGLLVAAAAMSVIAAPELRLRAWTWTASRELTRTAVARASAARASAELARITQSLAIARAFDSQRGRVTRIVGAIAELLPDSTAITTLRIDSAEVSLVALAPHVTDILPALAPLDSGAGPRITGTVTRETVSGTHLERATLRIKRVKSRKLARPSNAPARR